MMDDKNKNILAALGMQDQKTLETPKVDITGAGIQATGNLLGGLLANKAAQEVQMRQLGVEAEKMAAEESAKARMEAQKSQQDALSRLMGSFKSALT